MKIAPWLFATILLIVTDPVYAVNGTLSGGSGLLVMRTAETLDRGAVDLNAFGWADGFVKTGNPYRYTGISFMPEINVGLVNNLEVGVASPYLFNTDSSTSGFSAVRGLVKYRFIHAPKAGVGVAVTAFDSLHTPEDVRFGSGRDNYGIELNISLPRLLEPAGDLHVTVGFEKTDIANVDHGLTYERVIKRKLDVGYETPMFGRTRVSLELLLTRWSPFRTNVLILPGIRYHLSDRLEIMAAAGLGLPRHETPPGYRFIGGVSYLFDIPGWAAAPGGKP